MIRPGRGRRAAWLGVALAIAAVVVPGPPAFWAPGTAVAAGPDVTLVSATTYDVLPEEHRVAVSVEITATSHLHDTTTRHYFTEKAYLAVLPGTSDFRISAPVGSPRVSVSARRTSGTVLLLTFGSRLGAGKSLGLTLTFSLPDPGGAPDRPLRISPSLVSFPAWAFGTDGVPGSSVRVRLPAAYEVFIGRGPLTGPTIDADGRKAWTSASLSTPGTFVADVAADRPGVLQYDRHAVLLPERRILLLVRAWPDDPAWAELVSDLLRRGLPALDAAVGLDWPLGDVLTVRETLVRPASAPGGGGDAARFDPAASALDVPYTADATVILHGAAHGWFNGGLVADYWIAEGFAALYAEHAGTTIGAPVATADDPDPAPDSAPPLNAWVPGGTSDEIGRAAALALARAVEIQAGDVELRAVWRAVASGAWAYQPGPAASAGVDGSASVELGAPPADWRTLLDLLEERTGRSFGFLWRTWVVRPEDATQLNARADARALYAATADRAGPWTLPREIRDAMRAWRFAPATDLMQAAVRVLDLRDEIARRSAAAGLVPPTLLRTAFEGPNGLAAAAAEAGTELAVINRLEAVAALRPSNPDPARQIGLVGTNPERVLASAGEAFASGDLDAALGRAIEAESIWATSPEVGRRRIGSSLALGVALVVLIWLVVQRYRRLGVSRARRAAIVARTRSGGDGDQPS